jgi:phosphopantothenoylcysteine decarboxylase
LNKPNILLGLTGSVASTLGSKLLEKLNEVGNVIVVQTERSKNFVKIEDLVRVGAHGIYHDNDEWAGGYEKGDEVLHIKLRKWADVMVVAPLSANTLAKVANGISDNLLTSILRAWDMKKPCVFAPAMNTLMWEHPATAKHIATLKEWFEDLNIVQPCVKTLACGDNGVGAMADVSAIQQAAKQATDPWFPLGRLVHEPGVANPCSGIPVAGHPGSFGYKRTWYTHPGVDLYTWQNARVKSMEPGVVVAIDRFTGAKVQSDWWLDTWAVAVEGRSGVILYGEIEPRAGLKVGDRVARCDTIGFVTPVLRPEKLRPDIPGHSCSMLHLELYRKGHHEICPGWDLDKPQPEYLLDPTELLSSAAGAPETRLTYTPPEAKEK